MATTRATTTSDEGASAVLSAYGTIAGEGIGRRRVGADAKASAYEEVEGGGARRRDARRRDATGATGGAMETRREGGMGAFRRVRAMDDGVTDGVC